MNGRDPSHAELERRLIREGHITRTITDRDALDRVASDSARVTMFDTNGSASLEDRDEKTKGR